MDEESSTKSAPGSEEENYFISLSDLMTGVVFIFVILLCAFAFDYKQAHEGAERARLALAGSTAGESSDAKDGKDAKHGEAGPKISPLAEYLRDRDRVFGETLQNFVDRLRKHGIRVEIDQRNGIVRLPEGLLFASGKADLNAAAIQALSVLAEELDPLLERANAPASKFHLEAVFIEGHTDNIAIQTTEFHDNWDLSTARANRTFRALIRARPALELYLNPASVRLLGVSGYGPNRPVDPADTLEARAKNRRIDLRFLLANPSADEIAEIERQLKKSTAP